MRNVVLNCDSVEGLKQIPDESVQCCVTSPPYWGLRDYGVSGQLGLEKTPEEYVANMVKVFREVRRVLRKDGTLWLNLGDSYAGSGKGQGPNGSCDPKQPKLNGMKVEIPELPIGLKSKDLVGIPWRVALALQADGWWLRSDIIWAKPNPMPESVTDRPTKSHEYIFLLTKSAKYYYDAGAVAEESLCPEKDYSKTHKLGNKRNPTDKVSGFRPREETAIYPTRNLRSVWTITTKPYSGAHFATFPPEIPEKCIKAGSKVGDIILDPFSGSGTTLEVAKRLGRDYIGIELNEKYVKELIEPRLANISPLFL